jgi:membrane-bound lytic murein transglycosylase D
VAKGPTRTQSVNGRTRVSYSVQSGDSLWTIAQRFGVSVDELKRWNSLGPSKRGLKVGSELQIWPEGGAQPERVQERGGTLVAQRAPASSAGAHPQHHELVAGESLWSVAQRYNVSVEDLKRWNKISNHRNVRPGQRLLVSAP